MIMTNKELKNKLSRLTLETAGAFKEIPEDNNPVDNKARVVVEELLIKVDEVLQDVKDSMHEKKTSQ
jgi:hypothetical protein